MEFSLRHTLQQGLVIPACPLALTSARKLDERRQRALCRYYLAAGVGGLAVAVHTTQFAIRDPSVGLLEPVLTLAAEELRGSQRPVVKIGGICGPTTQAVQEAELLRRLGYECGLLSLAALSQANDASLLQHCRAIAEIIPLFGFYLQPAVGGRVLSYGFWREFFEIENLVAVKIAPFNRYQTLDVVRAAAAAGRYDVALYTGNDDNIVLDLLTPYRFAGGQELRIVGGLLGHWSVWTSEAVKLFQQCREVARRNQAIPRELMRRAVEVTDCNAAFFDAANNYAGCIAGLHEVLRRQGLLAGIWCLDENESLSPGQAEEIDRVYRLYPHLHDDEFIATHRDNWLRP
jgi:dihydrodipicolinate synthase/N-acetylneuraminate lyase